VRIGKSIKELRSMQVPNPWRAMGPWLTNRCLVMVHAWRGTGKTYFALGLAKAIATGGRFLKWDNEVPFRVAYFDGEMGAANLQPRMAEIDPSESIPSDFLHFITFEDCGGSIWNLADPIDQKKYSEVLSEFDIAIIDNLSCCARPVGRFDNEFTLTERVKAWANVERSREKSIIFIHHSGKSGAQRGTSSREDNLDTVINLIKPRFQPDENISSFEIHFEKARNFHGADQQAIHVDFGTTDREIGWKWMPLKEKQAENTASLLNRGWSQSDIANYLGISLGEVRQYAKSCGDFIEHKKLELGSAKDEDFDLF
jgi:RecA-family ATPase